MKYEKVLRCVMVSYIHMDVIYKLTVDNTIDGIWIEYGLKLVWNPETTHGDRSGIPSHFLIIQKIIARENFIPMNERF